MGIPWAAFGPNQEVGLTDEEYLWEPAPGGWSLRRRGEATSPMVYGAGDWVLDFALPEPKPAPVTTIAWRLGHLYTGCSLRWEWSFGARQRLTRSNSHPGRRRQWSDSGR